MKHSLWITLVLLSPAFWSGGPAGWASGQGAEPIPQAASSAAAAPVADKADSYYHYLRASDLIARGSYTDAGAEFRLAIEANPGDADLLVEYADFLIQTQNLAEAHKQLERCLQLAPDNLEAHRMLAGLYAASVGEGGTDPKVQELAQKAVTQYEEVLRLDPSDAQSLFALGRLYYRLQQPEKAEQYMKRFATRSDGSLEGSYYLTLIYAGQKKYAEALETLGNMEKLRPESLQIQLLKADILENLGRVAEAEKIYQRQIETSPAEPAPYQQYARVLLKDKQEDRALAVLEQARTNLAADEDILSMLGQVYRDRQNFDKAIQAFKDAITLAPTQLDSRYQLGLTYAQMGDALNAIPIFQSLLRDTEPSASSPGFDPGMRRLFVLNLGFLYMDTRKFSNAMGVFQGFLKEFPNDPEPAVYIQMAEIFRNLDQNERALAAVEEGLKRLPDNQRLINERGLILVGLGRSEEAVREQEAKVGPDGSDDVNAYLGLAGVFAEAKRWDEALRVVDEAIQKFDKNTVLIFQKASILEKSGRYADADAVFKGLLDSDPENATAMNYQGYMLIDYDLDVNRGMQLVEKALQYEPKNPAFLDSLGWGYFKKKDYKKALEYLQQAVRGLADDPTLLEHLGDVHRALGKTHEARDYYEKALPLTREPAERNRLSEKIKKLKPKLQM